MLSSCSNHKLFADERFSSKLLCVNDQFTKFLVFRLYRQRLQSNARSVFRLKSSVVVASDVVVGRAASVDVAVPVAQPETTPVVPIGSAESKTANNGNNEAKTIEMVNNPNSPGNPFTPSEGSAKPEPTPRRNSVTFWKASWQQKLGKLHHNMLYLAFMLLMGLQLHVIMVLRQIVLLACVGKGVCC